jgi:hypothetical protein
MADIKVYLRNETKTWDAGAVCQLSYIRRADTPCDSFECTVPGNSIQPEAAFVYLYLGDNCIFEGIVDKQTQFFSAKASYLRIYSRRKIAALLMDNEARARDYRSIRMSDLATVHARPYGIKDVLFKEDRRAPIFTVAKGMSEWETLALFARQIYGLTPYIDEKNRLVLQGRSAAHRHYFSNLDSGSKWSRYISFKAEYNPSKVLSHIYVINESGSQTFVENRRAGSVTRRRFLSPSTEWALFPRQGGEELIRQSMERRLILELEVPDFLDCTIGDIAVVKEFSPTGELTLDEAELSLDGECKTRLLFRE